MTKFFGSVGYVSEPREVSLGVWKEEVTEVPYPGDLLRTNVANSSGEKVNNDVRVSHRISIVSDPYSEQFNVDKIRYVIWQGSRWEVVSTDPSDYPRIVLSLGGIYNGPTP